jgi:YggT family protein
MFSSFLLTFFNMLFQVITLAIVARCLLSWVPIGPNNPFYPLAVILHQVTEPILGPLRRVIPSVGMFDISPIVALLLIQWVIQPAVMTALSTAARAF